MVPRGSFWSSCLVRRVGRLLAVQVAQTGHALHSRRQSALPCRHHVRNVRVQRAIERYAGDRGPGERRWRYPMGRLPHNLDELEPRANGCGPDCRGLPYRGLLLHSVDERSVTIARRLNKTTLAKNVTVEQYTNLF